MTDRVLTRRELNRTLLARQMLLERHSLPIVEAVERLVGLQAQVPDPPYIGLWTRLENFQRDALTRLMEQRKIVRAAMMRSTLHLITANDHKRFRSPIQSALTRGLNAFFGQRAKGLDIEKLIQTARPFIEEKPRSTGEIRSKLLEIEPDRDPDALAYAVRTYLALVQVPPGGTWGKGSLASYATAEKWIGQHDPSDDLRGLFFRYLAAFGPASVMDFQTWVGITKLQATLEQFKSELRTFRDENGVELLDIPDLPIIASDTPTPARFIPEYDNLLIAHSDRTRVIADEYRSKVFLSAGRVRATVLLNGFVRGAWKVERSKTSAALGIELFAPVSEPEKESLRTEGEKLIRFIADNAANHEVQFVE